jgi:hypothetical protein
LGKVKRARLVRKKACNAGAAGAATATNIRSPITPPLASLVQVARLREAAAALPGLQEEHDKLLLLADKAAGLRSRNAQLSEQVRPWAVAPDSGACRPCSSSSSSNSSSVERAAGLSHAAETLQ